MDEQITGIILDPANEITDLIANRLYPILIDSANVYPAMAWDLEIEEKDRGAKCVTYEGLLTIMVESKTRRDLKTLKRRTISAFESVPYYRFKRASDDYNRTTKTYYSELFINIIQIKSEQL